MPAPVVVVHDEVDTCEAILHVLSGAGLAAVGFTCPMAMLDAIEKDSETRVLVSRVSFGPGKINGIALYRMLDHKRVALGVRAPLRAVFIGRPDYRREAEQEGMFLPKPFQPQALVALVRQLLKPAGAAALRIVTRPIIMREGDISVGELSSRAATPRFSPRTDRLVREAERAVQRAVALGQWRMTIRRPFQISL